MTSKTHTVWILNHNGANIISAYLNDGDQVIADENKTMEIARSIRAVTDLPEAFPEVDFRYANIIDRDTLYSRDIPRTADTPPSLVPLTSASSAALKQLSVVLEDLTIR